MAAGSVDYKEGKGAKPHHAGELVRGSQVPCAFTPHQGSPFVYQVPHHHEQRARKTCSVLDQRSSQHTKVLL